MAQQDTANNTNQLDHHHFEVNLKVVIPIDWVAFMAVFNDGGFTNTFNYLIRLFWALI